MRKAAVAGTGSVGVTIASTFAPSLGLTVQQQHVGFAFGVFLMLLAVALFLHQRREEAQTMSNDAEPPINQNVTGNTVGGDLTVAGVVQIHAPDPAIHVRELSRNQAVEPPQTGFQTQVGIRVDSSYAAHSLYIRASAPSITQMYVTPLQGSFGLTREQPDPYEPGVVFKTIVGTLKPVYVAHILSDAPEAIEFECILNGQHPGPPLSNDLLSGQDV